MTLKNILVIIIDRCTQCTIKTILYKSNTNFLLCKPLLL